MTKWYDIDLSEVAGIFGQLGRLRGVVLHTDAEYVRKHYGANALDSVEEVTAELGCPISYKSIKTMAWYPAVLRGISLLAIARALDFSVEDLRKMGWAAPRTSIISKIMMRYFASLQMLVDKLPEYWERNYDVGALTGKLLDHKVELTLTGLEIPSQLFPYLEGYFTSVVGMVIGNKKKATMTDITQLNGDEVCYRLVISWKNNS